MTTPGNALDQALADLNAKLAAQEELLALARGDIAAIFEALEDGDCNGNGEEPPPDDGNGEEPDPPDEPEPEPEPEPQPVLGIWLSAAEAQMLPRSGEGWALVMEFADNSVANPNPGNQNDNTDAAVIARALVHLATGSAQFRDEVISALEKVQTWDPDANSGTNVLSVCRNLAAYIVAADMVGYRTEAFESWIRDVLSTTFTGGGGNHTVAEHHDLRPNNHGTHAGVSRLVAAIYLGETEEAEKAIAVFRGYLGDRAAYSGFKYGPLAWQVDATKPVGINPKGAKLVIGGAERDVDGVLPDDQRRQDEHGYPLISWPPGPEGYVWEALQGVVAMARIVERYGYTDVWSWSDSAILRAVQWLHKPHFAPSGSEPFPAEGDDTGTPWIINDVYGTSFPTKDAEPGKNGLGLLYQWLSEGDSG